MFSYTKTFHRTRLIILYLQCQAKYAKMKFFGNKFEVNSFLVLNYIKKNQVYQNNWNIRRKQAGRTKSSDPTNHLLL